MNTYECKECGKLFRAYALAGGEDRKFCSVECMRLNMTGKTYPNSRKGLVKECPVCNNPFYCYPSEINTRRTCSKACGYEIQRREGVHTGENCNFWTGGTDHYRGKNWYRQRSKARKRDNNTCQKCGRRNLVGDSKKLAVHHIVPFRFFENDYKKANDLDNLITLCHGCHAKQESHQWSKVPAEFLHLLKGVVPQEKPPSGERYTLNEIDFIKSNYDKLKYEDLAKKMGRSLYSLADKICELGLKKGNATIFSQEDAEFIKKYYPSESKEFFQERFPSISYNTIKSFANRAGLRKNTRGLTDKEKELVNELYPVHGINYVHEKLPHRTKNQIKSFIDNNKIKKQDNTERSL